MQGQTGRAKSAARSISSANPVFCPEIPVFRPTKSTLRPNSLARRFAAAETGFITGDQIDILEP